MASELIVTETQWEKLVPLSLNASVAFFAVKWGLIDQAAFHARNVLSMETEKMDWLGYLAGIPVEEVPPEVWENRKEHVTELVNEWLMGGIN
jgi:hypothetical protein